MKEQNDINPSELADLLEKKAKKLRETNDLNSVVGGEEDDPDGGCAGGCCGSKCVMNSNNCSYVVKAYCRNTCIGKSSN